MKTVLKATQKTLSKRSSVVIFLLSAFFIFALFVMLPVWTTPGNDIAFQLSIIDFPTYALMIGLSLTNGLLIAMQFYLRREARAKAATGRIKKTAAGSGIVASTLLSTIACASCYSSVLALFGVGGTVFIVEHRWWFATVAFGLVGFALVMNSRRIVDGCKVCEVKLEA